MEVEPASEIPGPRRAPSAAAAFGRGLASVADVTVGGLIPGAIQYGAYPLLRATGQTPEQAAAGTRRMVEQVDQPFGKAFGVSGTPEYEQEPSRRLMNFVNENFQKGAKWIADKTGVPQSDVESVMATATLTAPKVGAGVAKVAAPAVQQARMGAELAVEPLLQARRERLSAESYARGPQIDAAKEAQRLKIALNPTDVQPSATSRLYSAAAGDRGQQAIVDANKNNVRNVALNELGLPPTTQLNSAKAFDQARTQVAKPYADVSKLPTMVADDQLVARLDSLRADPNIIGAKDYAPAIDKIVDNAISSTQAGLTGDQLLKNVRVLRERARKTYNNRSATIEALDIADTNLAVANSLESMIESNIFNPRLLTEFRDARRKMARAYAYEGATDFNTGVVDVGKLSRITAKDSTLTGDIAALGRIAGNFPDAFTPSVASPMQKAVSLGRTGVAGTLGGVAGYLAGQDYLSAALGSVVGAGAGRIVESAAARRVASPGYQAGLNVLDYRIPVNQLAAATAPPIPQNRALVPYEPPPPEVLMPGEGPYSPNFILQPNQYPPRATFVGPQSGPPQLPAPSAEATLNALRAEDTRRAGVSRAIGQEAEARQAAAEAAARRPAGSGVPLVFDEKGNLIPAPTSGAGGVVGAPSALESAVQKLSGEMIAPTETQFRRTSTGKWEKKETTQGPKFYIKSKTTTGPSTREPRAFDLTAAEKVAWERTKVDLAEVAPGLKALTDKAVAEKMMDRQWVESAVVKAREKAAAYEQIAARAKDAQARREALAKREQLMDVLQDLEDQLRPGRAVSGTGQGPKTRAFNRNRMLGGTENTNALTKRD